MTKQDMMKANRDPQREIKVCEAHLMHVLLQRTDYHPTKPEIHSTVERVSTFTPEDFQKMEGMRNPKKAIGGIFFSYDWVRVAGYQQARVIHDGTAVDPELKKQIEEFWDNLLHPKKTEVENLADQMKQVRRKLNIR